MKKATIGLLTFLLPLMLFIGWPLSAFPLPQVAAHSASPLPDQERVAKNKQTILARLKRDKIEYRGDKPGEIKIRWEWVNRTVSNYTYHKDALVRELSAGEKYELRPHWVFKDMKITFQELFGLSNEDDDKLFPLSSSSFSLLSNTSNATFEGLTLLGKQGETKGPFKTKVVVNGFLGYRYLGSLLQYLDKDGKERIAIGLSDDAYTLRWKDLKNRLADDMSEEKALEDLRLERDKISADTIRTN